MKKEVRSQAALEFLTTYAWAFLVIMITVGSLYYFGVFDFGKFLPQKCMFTSQFECLDYSLAGSSPYGELDDTIRFKLVNNLGEKINVNSIDIASEGVNSLECASPSPLPGWQPGDEHDFIFTNCENGVFLEGQRIEAIITMIYCAPATNGCLDVPPNPLVLHTITGKINAIVNSP